jgi:hypothetical protein
MTDAASRPRAVSPPERTARPRWRGREGDAMRAERIDDNYTEVTTTTRRWSWRRGRWGTRKDVAGTGRNSCR